MCPTEQKVLRQLLHQRPTKTPSSEIVPAADRNRRPTQNVPGNPATSVPNADSKVIPFARRDDNAADQQAA